MREGGAKLRHPPLLNILNKINEVIPYSWCSGMDTLDDVVLMECHKEMGLFLWCAAIEFRLHESAVFCIQIFYQSSLASLN